MATERRRAKARDQVLEILSKLDFEDAREVATDVYDLVLEVRRDLEPNTNTRESERLGGEGPAESDVRAQHPDVDAAHEAGGSPYSPPASSSAPDGWLPPRSASHGVNANDGRRPASVKKQSSSIMSADMQTLNRLVSETKPFTRRDVATMLGLSLQGGINRLQRLLNSGLAVEVEAGAGTRPAKYELTDSGREALAEAQAA